ncbi:antirestriction protein [Frigidibacter sp. RF13]|uniref:antirestriction protein n=1 Tax=Frigidibacter sp. RF13 TaxID=2997340 RepID=UPI00226F304D|nr:antirestriction protein [Frigidibacter sp. RF13]MCY1128456.1 antirestriction protein [Frigidibacter sp. RF13]
MTHAAIAQKPATLVPEARRMAFLPELFSPTLMLIGERSVYQFMSWLAPDDYAGGLWHFHERGGQPLFMSPDADKRFRIFCETNGYMGEVSAEAAGIIATLFALSHLSFRHEADQLSEAYMRLYEFAGDHPEAGEMFKAID